MKQGCILRGVMFLFVVLTFSFSSPINYDYLKDVQLVNKIAGLSYLEQPAISRIMDHSITFLQYGAMDGQTKTQFANVTIPGYFFTLALTVKHDVISGINQTGQDNTGKFFVQDVFEHEKTAAMLTFSQKVPRLPIYYGINAKAYSQKVVDTSMTGYGFDAGIMVKLGGTIIGATYNDINNTLYTWENGTEDLVKSNFSYQVVQLLPFGYLSYVASELNDDYVKLGLDVFGVIGIESKVFLTDVFSASVSCALDLGAFEVGARQDFNEVYGGNSQFSMTIHL